MKPFFRVLQVLLLALAVCTALGFFVSQDAIAATHPVLASNTYAARSCPATIAYGSRGPLVSDLQTRLNNAGWRDPDGKKLIVDGIFGSKTLFVVKNFQSIYAPPADGIVGPNTWSALGACHNTILV